MTPVNAAELAGFWAEASEALLLFPLTEPLRRALLQLVHVPSPALQVKQSTHLVPWQAAGAQIKQTGEADLLLRPGSFSKSAAAGTPFKWCISSGGSAVAATLCGRCRGSTSGEGMLGSRRPALMFPSCVCNDRVQRLAAAHRRRRCCCSCCVAAKMLPSGWPRFRCRCQNPKDPGTPGTNASCIQPDHPCGRWSDFQMDV